MACKFILLGLTLLMQTSCTFGNMFEGQDDYLKKYHAKELKESIDSSIKHESKKGAPSGFIDRSYSEENWNRSWNKRIFHLYEFEKKPFMKAYEGPSGVEFIRYIIVERRRRGLPELIVEDRNKNRVPKDLIKE